MTHADPDRDQEGEARRMAQRYVLVIQRALDQTAGLPEIDALLAIGGVCKATRGDDRAIWLAVTHRMLEGRI